MNYLYDTNILAFIIKQVPEIEKLEKEITHDTGALRIISIVTKAEIETLAVLFDWGEKKREQLTNLLEQFLIIPIDSEQIVAAYVEIDTFSQGKHPNKSSGLSARNMGKNDLWIAATALVTDSTLLTSDGDFNHLNGVFIPVKKLRISKSKA
ncbi:hypothetical protein BH09BAC3_BH09BAC3_26790 [soil metagenome]